VQNAILTKKLSAGTADYIRGAEIRLSLESTSIESLKEKEINLISGNTQIFSLCVVHW